jgi:hypothetical protein
MTLCLNSTLCRTLRAAVVATVLVVGTSSSSRAITVTAPADVLLQKNTAGQTLQIMVSGVEEIAGLSLAVQIADGGPGPVTQGLIDGPDITNVDLLGSAIFGANNEGVDDVGSFPQLARRSVLTQPNTTIPLSNQPALLATITLSTVGVAPGTYALILGGIPAALSNTEFFSAAGDTLVPTFVNGSVTVVPEPSSVMLAVLAGATAIIAGRRKVCYSPSIHGDMSVTIVRRACDF